jgi:hypothetical protein
MDANTTTEGTAVEQFNWWVNWELESLLDGTLGYNEFKKIMETKFLEAMAMEKQQIIEANEDCSTNELGELLTGEQYYNQTYNL